MKTALSVTGFAGLHPRYMNAGVVRVALVFKPAMRNSRLPFVQIKWRTDARTEQGPKPRSRSHHRQRPEAPIQPHSGNISVSRNSGRSGTHSEGNPRSKTPIPARLQHGLNRRADDNGTIKNRIKKVAC